MQVLKQLPFVKLLVPTIIGISCVIIYPQLGSYSIFLLVSSLLLFVFFTLNRSKLLFIKLKTLSIFLIFLSFGGLLSHYKNPRNHNQNLENAGLNGVYLIRITEIPQIKLKTIKIQANVLGRIIGKNKILKADELALFYFDKQIQLPKPGDELIVKCNFKPIPEPENPYQFNYKRFLKWQGIYYQTFVKNPENVISTKVNSATFFQLISYKGSQYLKQLFIANIHDSTALGVTESLIFGYKEDIPKDLVESYSRTGTLHVLAVSGLHVAIVFLMLANFLWFLDRWRYGVWLKTVIVLVCIWVYCILTGMAPSIIRAGLMISLVLVGKALNRNANIFNTIAVSAFFILCINPFWLLNVGFQLSFAAVIGIVYLQEYLIPLWTPPNWLLRQVWNILIISICAQIATFPLSLFYFNQFPNYFLLSNLIIIPLTSIVIYTGIGMVIFSKIPFLLLTFSWLTEHFVKMTNYLVVTIEKFPFSFIDGMKINFIQLILLYICIGFTAFWYINTSRKGIINALLCLVLILSVHCFDTIKSQAKRNIVIFNIPNQNALLVSDGKRSVLISDNTLQAKEMFYIRGWLIHNRLWPLYQSYSFKNIDKYHIEILEMDLSLKRGLLFFKGTTFNLSSKNLGKFTHKYSYILPKYFDWNGKYDDNMRDSVLIGQEKTKRLQKKVKKFLSNYHNYVIYDVQDLGFILFNINN